MFSVISHNSRLVTSGVGPVGVSGSTCSGGSRDVFDPVTRWGLDGSAVRKK